MAVVLYNISNKKSLEENVLTLKSKIKTMSAIAVFVTVLTATISAAEVISPVNGAVDVMPGEKLSVNYFEPVNAEEKTVTVNNSTENISVAANENVLTVAYKNMGYGKRYKTVIADSEGQTELVTFFNTGFEKFETIMDFKSGNMDKLWNGKKSQGAEVEADSEALKIISNTKGTVGGRINSSEFNVNASQKNVLTIRAFSENDVDLKIYFSKTGGNGSFSDSFEIPAIKGGEEAEYTVTLGEVEGWNGEIKQFLIEQTTKIDNSLTIKGLKIVTEKEQNTYIGDFDLYSGYETETETIITGGKTEAGTITASLAAIESSEEKTAVLIIAKYRDGFMTGAECVAEDLSDGKTHSAVTVSIDAESGETVKSFLRKGTEDIRIIKECISAEIE